MPTDNPWIATADTMPPVGERVRVWARYESHAKWSGIAWGVWHWVDPVECKYFSHWQRIVGPGRETK